MPWTRNPNFVYRDEDDDGALLFDPDIDDCVGLNLTAKAVWENLERVNAGDYGFMADLFDDVPDNEIIQNDVAGLLEELRAINAITFEDN